MAFVVVPVVCLNLSNNHTEVIGDTRPAVPTAVSLWTEGDTDLDEFLGPGFVAGMSVRPGELPYFLQERGGHVYSAYPSGMVAFALPVVGLSRLAGGRLGEEAVHLRLEKLTAAAVAAASAGAFFPLALYLVRPAPALATTAVLAVASGMFSTVGQNLWQHGGVILGSLSLLLLEFRGAGRPATVVQGVICGVLPACRMTAATFLGPFWVWVALRSPRRAAVFALVAGFAYLPWAAYYGGVYGSPFGPSSGQMAGSQWSAAVAWPLAGVLLSPGRGLLVYQPWLVLTPLAALPAVRRAGARPGVGDGPRAWAAVGLAAAGLQVATVAAWWCWWGGYCWGSRLVIEAVPLCALVCARPVAVLFQSRRGRSVLAGLALLGALAQVPGVYLDGLRRSAARAPLTEASVWSWSNTPFLAPFARPSRP